MQASEQLAKTVMGLCKKAIGLFLAAAIISVTATFLLDKAHPVGLWRVASATAAGVTAIALTAVVGACILYLVFWWQLRAGK